MKNVIVCNTIILITLAVYLVMITLSSLVIAWLEKLSRSQQCDCSKSWHREYIVRFLSFLFVWNIALGSVGLYRMYQNRCGKPTMLPIPVAVLNVLFGIGIVLYLFFAYYYIKMLKERKCTCAMKEKGYKIMQVHVIIFVSLIAFAALMPVLALIAVTVYAFLKTGKP